MNGIIISSQSCNFKCIYIFSQKSEIVQKEGVATLIDSFKLKPCCNPTYLFQNVEPTFHTNSSSMLGSVYFTRNQTDCGLA